MTKIIATAIFFLQLLSFGYSQPTFPVNGVYDLRDTRFAFVNARVYTDYRTVIDSATLLIKNGKVEDAGQHLQVPADAVVYDLQGKWIYPSFIDLYSDYGMPVIKKQERKENLQYTSATKGAYHWNQAVRPEVQAYRLFTIDTEKAEMLRGLGFGVVLSHLWDGIARGSSVLVALGETKENNLVLKAEAAVQYSFDKGTSAQIYPTSLMGAIALLRQTYLDAQWYKETAKNSEFNISLDAWNRLQHLPQIFEVSDKLSALRADKLGDEFGVQYILKGAGDEYQRIGDIRSTKAAFIIPLNFPLPADVEDSCDALQVTLGEMKHWELAPVNPYTLEKAKVDFSLTSSGVASRKDFFTNLRKAIACGLSEQQALKSLTYTPATLIGMSEKTGMLKKGMDANFIICSGDVFRKESRLLENWVEGIQYIIAPDTKDDTIQNKSSVSGLQDSVILPAGDVCYPSKAFGWKEFPRNVPVLITNATVWTNEAEGILLNTDVLLINGKIARIGKELTVSSLNLQDLRIVDGTGKHLTSGIIDEHAHIALSGGVNESGQAVSAEVRTGDVLNSDDINIYRQLAGGVTTSQILHGSANPIGGQSSIIKLRWGVSPEYLKLEGAPQFIKFALGENVKQSNAGSKYVVRFPQSRLGVEQVYMDAFTRAKEYSTEWKMYNNLTGKEKINASPPRKDLELDALCEIVDGKRFITCHSYVQSEINMLLHVADSMCFKVNTFTHVLEGYKVADKLKAHGAGASTFSDWWAYKYEVADAIPYNGSLLFRAGVVTAFNSDDAEMGRRLNQEAAKAVKYGALNEEEAWKFVTLNPARLLHIDNRTGSIRIGKDADVVLWNNNPLSIYARVEITFVDGIPYYDRVRDKQMQEEVQQERARLIRLMIDAKKRGEKTRNAAKGEELIYHCDTTEE